ncbi:mitochondrial amidoxime reducing component 2 isoform X2 [Dendroctonus ponderosae]|uniref:MOSC domain-containing protein n=1 Tax=Dendroctonus ponderosae TaxID=77166 RepID=A0AAR5P0S3_DENPD|nr:mitochondrial amidoxime reducing component 2 isoform X2 [Dendroctonus ponderosae]
MRPADVTLHVAVGVSSVVLTVLGAVILKKLLAKEKIPKKWRKIGTVEDLIIYPVKSAKGINADRLFVTEKGVKEIEKRDNSIELRDRSFLIYTSKDREVRTARQLPKSVTIGIQAAENGIILSAPNKIDLYLSLPRTKNDIKVTFGNEAFWCTDCGEVVAKWLSDYLLNKSEGLRLGYGDGSQERNVLKDHKKWAAHYTNMDNSMAGIFSDLAALHLINKSTIDDLNSRLGAEQKVSIKNFRPNVFVEGPEAFDEDNWEHVKIGDVVTKVCLECLRCIQSTVSENGEMSKEREPLKTLEKYRKSDGPFKYGRMGIYLRVLKIGKIRKGDAIYVPEKINQ